MDQQIELQKNTKETKLAWILVSAILSGLIVGLAIFLWQSSVAKNIQTQLNSEVYVLEAQLAQMQNQNKSLKEQVTNLQKDEILKEDIARIDSVTKNNELSSYQNERHSYEIKYPNEYKVKKVENPVSISSEKSNGTEFNIEVSYLEGKTFEEWIKNDIGFEDLSLLNPEEITLGGKKGLKINEPGHGEGIFHYYVATEKTGNDIIVDISTWSENFINEDFNKIISTFKFIN